MTAQLLGGGAAIMAFFLEYMLLPNDADVEVSIGHVLDKPTERLLIISVSHPDSAIGAAIGMPADDAREFANIVEQTMHRFPHEKGLPNLILALRGGVDLLERTQ